MKSKHKWFCGVYIPTQTWNNSGIKWTTKISGNAIDKRQNIAIYQQFYNENSWNSLKTNFLTLIYVFAWWYVFLLVQAAICIMICTNINIIHKCVGNGYARAKYTMIYISYAKEHFWKTA